MYPSNNISHWADLALEMLDLDKRELRFTQISRWSGPVKLLPKDWDIWMVLVAQVL